MSGNNLVILVFIVITIVVIRGVVRVPEYQRIVVFRFGRKLEKSMGPGLVFIIPILDRVVTVDLRETVAEFSLPVLTKDVVPVSISFRWHFIIVDLAKFVASLEKEESGTDVFDTMKAISFMEEFDSTELSERIAYLNRMLRLQSDEVTKPIGVKIIKVEILNLGIDHQLENLYKAKVTVGTFGETQSLVHTAGTVLVDNKSWNAISDKPIVPNTKVRIKRIILEVEEDVSFT